MSLKKIILALLLILTSTLLYAADKEEEPKQSDKSLIATPDPTEPQIPKRELKFDISEEEQPLTLDNVQEGMLDQRYVATFKLMFFKKEKQEIVNEFERAPGMRRNFPTIINGLANVSILSSYGRYSNPKNPTILSALSHYQQIWFKKYDQRFSKSPEYTDLFNKNSQDERPVRRTRRIDLTNTFIKIAFSQDNTGNPSFLKLELLSTNRDEAAVLVREWLRVYDIDLCDAAQKECLSEKTRLEKLIAEINDELKKKEAELSMADKYKEFDDITPDALVSLKTQRRMLLVDLAGIKARLNACEEMLINKSMSVSRKEQVENTKIAAEIEFRGLEAKQDEIGQIIQGAQHRQKILSDNRSLNNSIQSLKSRINLINNCIKEIDDYQLGFQPLPVEDNNVAIRRIKWVSPPKLETPQSQSN
jgi:hypothetical protein